VLELMDQLGLDAARETPGRGVVRLIGESLVEAMELARQKDSAEGAQLVACEAVVQAETKDHLNWELLHEASEKAKGDERKALGAAYERVEILSVASLAFTAAVMPVSSMFSPSVRPDRRKAERLDPQLAAPAAGVERRRADRGHEGGAEQITREVKGVRDVINNLRIQAAAR
jgi:hypothetical protein